MLRNPAARPGKLQPQISVFSLWTEPGKVLSQIFQTWEPASINQPQRKSRQSFHKIWAGRVATTWMRNKNNAVLQISYLSQAAPCLLEDYFSANMTHFQDCFQPFCWRKWFSYKLEFHMFWLSESIRTRLWRPRSSAGEKLKLWLEQGSKAWAPSTWPASSTAVWFLLSFNVSRQLTFWDSTFCTYQSPWPLSDRKNIYIYPAYFGRCSFFPLKCARSIFFLTLQGIFPQHSVIVGLSWDVSQSPPLK